MSEQKQGYMAELDTWTEDKILSPFGSVLVGIHDAQGDDAAVEAEKRYQAVIERIKQDIREKVLQSYRNGQAAGPRRPFKARQRNGR